jgi:Fe-S cluster assembly protein SufD
MSRTPREDVVARPIVKPLKTQAETALAAAYAASRDDGASPALRETRDRAFAVFEKLGLPSRRVEAWHYTDLRGMMKDAYPVSTPIASHGGDTSRISIVDGAAPTGLADLNWPAGLRVRSLRDALSSDTLIESKLFPGLGADDSVVALNAALARDGVVIEVDPGATIAAPIELAFASNGYAERTDYSRSLIVVGAGASVTIVESHASSKSVQRNNALIFHLGDGARVDHVFVTEKHDAEIHVATLIAELAANAQFNSFGFISDGQSLRRQCFARCTGENVKVAFRGVSLLSGKRHADNTLVIDHAVPHGESRELFKHIIADEATGVFQGKVVVRQHAQKTDGGMKSQALLLSDDAAMYNKPELEIFADDVVCGHGATVGQLDKEQLFYLMARGLPRANAEALLLEGFARDAIDFVANETIRERLDAALAAWLEGRSK